MSKIQKSLACLAFISILCLSFSNCSSDGGSSQGDKPSSNSASKVTLNCTGLPKSVAKGGTIDEPDLICSNDRTATNKVWNGLPDGNWEVDPRTNATSYVISVTATCGSVELVDVPCGTVKVAAASSSSAGGGSSSSLGGGSSSSGVTVTLTCTDLQASVSKGGTITRPTLACSNDETPSEETWTGQPLEWTVNEGTNAESYTISVSANCGTDRQIGVSCGTVNVTAASSSSVTGGSSSSVTGEDSSSSVNPVVLPDTTFVPPDTTFVPPVDTTMVDSTLGSLIGRFKRLL